MAKPPQEPTRRPQPPLTPPSLLKSSSSSSSSKTHPSPMAPPPLMQPSLPTLPLLAKNLPLGSNGPLTERRMPLLRAPLCQPPTARVCRRTRRRARSRMTLRVPFRQEGAQKPQLLRVVVLPVPRRRVRTVRRMRRPKSSSSSSRRSQRRRAVVVVAWRTTMRWSWRTAESVSGKRQKACKMDESFKDHTNEAACPPASCVCGCVSCISACV
mmetsp:Transcript_19743/g.56648  ORF Transcript_19743/g.56648 Transcript_19743/m.56648 type:complete len:212 (+) Transcript_19743:539-1174(+)